MASIVCFSVIFYDLHAQSIYSFQGLGSLNHQGMSNNEAMGEVGIGIPSVWHVNTQNPANLVYNNFSTFQFGVQGERRKFTGDSISGSDLDGSLRFLVYAFPIKPGKWSSSFGILPLSSVNYNAFNEGTVKGDTSISKFINASGEGGLTNLFWSNGITIKPEFYVGIRINYTFGSINRQSQNTIDGEDIFANPINAINKTSYSDFNALFGATYRLKLSEDKLLNFGLTYSFESNMNGKNTLEYERLSIIGNVLETQTISNTDLDFSFPRTLGFGISYQKPNTYIIGIDVESQSWKKSSNKRNTFKNQYKVSMGGEWTPDFDNVNAYFKRATYRMGFNYLQMPYIVNDRTINDFGINFGASLPVSGASSVDLSFKFGQLGNTNNGLIKESYYKIALGATINDRWFIKRRYD